jgi:class 3 adenylate cyclase
MTNRRLEEWASGLASSWLKMEGSEDLFGKPSKMKKAELQKSIVASLGGPSRTVLFTDLVGHIGMMSGLGDQRERDVLGEYERITREVLKTNGGTEVKTLGDGFMASFASVTKAVECAVALQRAFADRDGEPLSVRVGLNAGELIEEDGDLFGAMVTLASRIAAKADGGEILVADTVRGLCSGREFSFADRGELVAKGFQEPVRVYEINWRE